MDEKVPFLIMVWLGLFSFRYYYFFVDLTISIINNINFSDTIIIFIITTIIVTPYIAIGSVIIKRISSIYITSRF